MSRKTQARVSECAVAYSRYANARSDMPPRTPSKKQDEESVTSSQKRDGSPVLKKAPTTLQLRSEHSTIVLSSSQLIFRRAVDSGR